MGNRNDWGVQAQSLILPPGAGPGDTKIVIGPDIPPELIIWGAAQAPIVTFQALVIYYRDATTYTFEGIGTFSSLPCYFFGTYDSVNTVYIWQRLIYQGGGGPTSLEWRVGSDALNTFAAVYNFQQLTINFDLSVGGDFTVQSVGIGVSQGRGRKDWIASQADTAAIGAETVVLTGNSMVWQKGRAYAIAIAAEIEPAVVPIYAQLQVRRTNLAGALVGVGVFPMTIAGVRFTCTRTIYVVNTSGADITDNVVLTLAGGGGNVQIRGSQDYARVLGVFDAGAASDFPNANPFS